MFMYISLHKYVLRAPLVSSAFTLSLNIWLEVQIMIFY